MPFTGNGTIIAQVTTQGNTDAWAKSGVMFRNSLAANSACAMMALTPVNGAAFQSWMPPATWRTTTGPAKYLRGPDWVELVRSGSNFTGYVSADGVNWTKVGTDSLTMNSTIYVGLCDTSHNTGLIRAPSTRSRSGSTTPTAPGGLSASRPAGPRWR